MPEPDVSALETLRRAYTPRLPEILARGPGASAVEESGPTAALADGERVREHFPRSYGGPRVRFVPAPRPRALPARRVGVVLSGGQAPGGHNVIAGLLDGLRAMHGDSRLHGFIGGPRGIFDEHHRELTPQVVAPYRNTGGFDLIGSGRDKIETAAQLDASTRVCRKLGLDALVIVGGDDSNTNAAVLAEHFLAHDVGICVVGVPKTIDGDLRGEHVELSFGFDTAVKLYSELIGNICRDSRSAGKYWHFVKLMGRSASHVTLECALQTRPNLALIGEEVRRDGATLAQIVERVADLVRRRAEHGKHYGVCLVPEGLIEFVPEMRALIADLNRLLAGGAAGDAAREDVAGRLPAASAAVFAGLPENIRRQLLMDRDSHGNVQVSLIETESLLLHQVRAVLADWRAAGRFSGELKAQSHFLGYEGRCAAPSNFDADYTYALGHVAVSLIAHQRTGYMASVLGLAGDAVGWQPLGVPLTSLMNVEERKGRPRPVIRKALVDLDGPAFGELAARRAAWETEDAYVYPGPIQYFGPPEVADSRTRTLLLERGSPRATG